MKEAVHASVPGRGPDTHQEGSKPIDGIWFTPDLTLEKASYLAYDPQLGNHRPVIAQFTQVSVLGAKMPRIVPAPRTDACVNYVITGLWLPSWGS